MDQNLSSHEGGSATPSRGELIQKYHQQLVNGIERIKAHLCTPGLPQEKIIFLTKKQSELENQLILFRSKYLSSNLTSIPTDNLGPLPPPSFATSNIPPSFPAPPLSQSFASANTSTSSFSPQNLSFQRPSSPTIPGVSTHFNVNYVPPSSLAVNMANISPPIIGSSSPKNNGPNFSSSQNPSKVTLTNIPNIMQAPSSLTSIIQQIGPMSNPSGAFLPTNNKQSMGMMGSTSSPNTISRNHQSINISSSGPSIPTGTPAIPPLSYQFTSLPNTPFGAPLNYPTIPGKPPQSIPTGSPFLPNISNITSGSSFFNSGNFSGVPPMRIMGNQIAGSMAPMGNSPSYISALGQHMVRNVINSQLPGPSTGNPFLYSSMSLPQSASPLPSSQISTQPFHQPPINQFTFQKGQSPGNSPAVSSKSSPATFSETPSSSEPLSSSLQLRRNQLQNTPGKLISDVLDEISRQFASGPIHVSSKELRQLAFSYLQWVIFQAVLSAKLAGRDRVTLDDLFFLPEPSVEKKTQLPPFPLDTKTFPIRGRIKKRDLLLISKTHPWLSSNSISVTSTTSSSSSSSKKNLSTFLLQKTSKKPE